MKKKVITTCPSMVSNISEFLPFAESLNIKLTGSSGMQTYSEIELIDLLKGYDGWIIGDDPTNTTILRAAKKSGLKAAVKWGVGVDNIDYDAFESLGIPVTNTPGVFGDEVSDLAITYVLGLFNNAFVIDRKVRQGNWYKPTGNSIRGTTIGVVGYGDIGKSICNRLEFLGANIFIYDPAFSPLICSENSKTKDFLSFPDRVDELDCLVLACPLNKSTRGLIDNNILSKLKSNCRIVNISRGGLINEADLINSLSKNEIYGCALDVYEQEPLSINSKLVSFDNVILGSHNASNTKEAVNRVSIRSLEILNEMLNEN
ncbi:MAG: phosphoglycerate dehydrogenase [Gammaproteobacteria bacterium]|nr:phosphoglycerate dehydrogenase [Gammaproteobacteria bacterium]